MAKHSFAIEIGKVHCILDEISHQVDQVVKWPNTVLQQKLEQCIAYLMRSVIIPK